MQGAPESTAAPSGPASTAPPGEPPESGTKPLSAATHRDRETGQIVELPYRSALKAVSWRVTGTLDTMLVSYIVTGNVTYAASIGMLEVVTKMVLYYLHERLWGKLDVGRVVKPAPDYQI